VGDTHFLSAKARVLARVGDGSPSDSISPTDVSGILDAALVDVGVNGMLENAMLCDLVRNSARGPVYGAYDMYYDWTYSEGRRARALAIAFAHADGLVVGDWEHAGPQPERREEHPPNGLENYYWKNSRATTDTFRDTLGEMRRLADHLAPTESPAEVALVFSEKSFRLSPGGTLSAYFNNVAGVYCALAQEHLQADVVAAEVLTPGRLKRYRVVLVPSAPALGTEEMRWLREWADQGGCLIALGEVAIETGWGIQRSDAECWDLLGVRFQARDAAPCRFQVKGHPTWPAFRPVRTPMDCRVGHFRSEPVSFRDGFVRIEPKEGTAILAVHEDGSSAATVCARGKGKAVFLSPNFLGLCYEGDRFFDQYAKIFLFGHFSDWPLIKKFRPGVRELIAGLVRAALADQGRNLPFVAEQCPEDVEVALRMQPRRQRMVLHLTNFGDAEPLGKIVVTVRPPGTARIRDAEMLSGATRFTSRITADGVRISVDGLGVHAAILVSFN
jgi:hypothetical protein